jgi:hypothetical protein
VSIHIGQDCESCVAVNGTSALTMKGVLDKEVAPQSLNPLSRPHRRSKVVTYQSPYFHPHSPSDTTRYRPEPILIYIMLDSIAESSSPNNDDEDATSIRTEVREKTRNLCLADTITLYDEMKASGPGSRGPDGHKLWMEELSRVFTGKLMTAVSLAQLTPT